MNLPCIPAVSSICSVVTRILGHNPGPRTLQGTNSYLVGHPNLPRILVDTASQGPGLEIYLRHLKSEFERCVKECPLSGIVLTHWHPDHTQGVSAVLDLARQHVGNVSHAANVYVPVYKFRGGPNLEELGYYAGPLVELHPNSVISVAQLRPDLPNLGLRVLHTPGHTEDHICLLLELDGKAVHLFTGDMILGHGSTTVQDLPSYMDSLNRTRHLVAGLETKTDSHPVDRFKLLPGHGLEIEYGLAKIDEYLDNRTSRIAKTREFFLSNPTSEWLSEDRILAHVYPEISEALRFAALLNLRHSLFWLAECCSDPRASPAIRLVARQSGAPVQLDQFKTWLQELDNYRTKERTPDSDLQERLFTNWEWMRLN